LGFFIFFLTSIVEFINFVVTKRGEKVMDLELRFREKYFDVTANGRTIKNLVKIDDALTIAREYANKQTESAKQALNKLQLQYLEATEQIGQLKAENKSLVLQLNQAIESDAKLNESLRVLKAENEKLSVILSETFRTIKEAPELNMGNYTDDEVEALNDKMIEAFGILSQSNIKGDALSHVITEARKGIEKAISESIFYTLGLYDIWNLLDSQQKETLTEAINIGLNVAIEPQQPKSCEGCEHYGKSQYEFCNECSYPSFKHYQPKER